MLKVYLAAVFLIGFTHGNLQVNEYFDTILNTVKFNTDLQTEAGLRPRILPGFETRFQDTVGGVKTNVLAEFSDGYAFGLTEPRRLENCNPPYYSKDGKTLSCTLALDNVKLEYHNNKMNYGKMPKVNFKLEATVPRILFSVEIAENLPWKPKAEKLSITYIGEMNVKYSNLGPLSRFERALSEKFKYGVKAFPFDEITTSVKYLFNGAAELVPFPV